MPAPVTPTPVTLRCAAASARALVMATLVAAPSASLAVDGAASGRVAELEQQILSLARANTLAEDTRAAVRAELDPLVEELLTLVPETREEESLPHVAGAWKTEWSDLQIDPRADKAAVFQVVSPDGHYWNITRYVDPDATVSTNLLRGAYTVGDFVLPIRFTDDLVLPGWLPAGADLTTVAALAEAGQLDATRLADSFAYRFEGELNNIYVSDDLRLVRSEVPRQGTILFVSSRADVVLADPAP